jgi:hypothetical protein
MPTLRNAAGDAGEMSLWMGEVDRIGNKWSRATPGDAMDMAVAPE